MQVGDIRSRMLYLAWISKDPHPNFMIASREFCGHLTAAQHFRVTCCDNMLL